VLEPAELPQRLAAFLSTRWDDGAEVTVSDFEQITGGYSRYMARFTAQAGAASTPMILRADPPPGQSIIDTDRTVEWDVVQAVAGSGDVRLPRMRWFDPGDELGSPAIVYEEVPGDTLFARLQVGDVTDHFGFTEPVADLAASIHGLDVSVLPEAIDRPASWDDYIDAGAAHWVEAEGAHAEADPFMRVVAAWLAANKPSPTELRVVHGDLQPPNIVIEAETEALHMLDWELVRVGDPREDLGWWVLASKSQPPDLIEADTEAFYARYRERTGLSEEVVNPATVAYFTVFSSLSVFSNVIAQTAKMSRGEPGAMSVAYMTNAIPFMHGVFVDAMRTAGAWREENP